MVPERKLDGILRRTEISMVRAMCGVRLKDRGVNGLMFMLCLNEGTDQLTVASSTHWCGDVLRRKYGHVLRRALDTCGERKGGRRKKTWEKQ